MNDDQATEAVRSAAMLERLAEGPAGSGDPEDDLAASRSTIHRALDRLSDCGWSNAATGATD